ncbi:MAG: RraA family protein [Bacteroidetes bacterium]|nr:RraA family protein [Bacteroidota bacterium]MDA1119585.1 RraA family protein [Bacteroidota bacterium]
MRLKALLIVTILTCSQAYSQQITLTKEQIIAITADWTGQRSEDGRPYVSEELLKRLKNISIEEAWGFLRNKGYHNQFEGDWMILKPGESMTGRALTVQYMPSRSDYHDKVMAKGKEQNRIGNFNSWPIDMLKPGDIYIADGYGKIIDGTLIGDNLGNAIYAKSKNGVIFYGSVRDNEGLEKIEGYNQWIKGYDPSYIQGMMLGGINIPIRIGRVTILPGDAILAKKGGIIAIPAHLLAELVISGEFTALRDEFGHKMLRDGTYTPGQIDRQWTDDIKEAFLSWINSNSDKLPMSRAELDAYMKERNW